MIHEYLSHGLQNAIKAKDLCKLTGLEPRDFQQIVERERRAGQPICASCGSISGYFLAENKEEIETYCRTLDSRIIEISKTREALAEWADMLPSAAQTHWQP